MKRLSISAILTAALVGLVLTPIPAAQAVNEHANEHAQVIAFWTPDKVAKAIPRDYVRGGGPVRPESKPGGGGGGGGGSTSVSAASWNGTAGVTKSTGKVLFAMGSGYYVCSASVVSDAKDDRSLILTAGHCVVDETNGDFATNWMFIPDYDAAPAPLTTNGSFCASTKYGCWAADFLVASDTFAGAGGFTDEATWHDYAFAVVSGGGFSGSDQLDATVGAQSVQFTAGVGGGDTYLFGYPAAGKFHGKDLTYSRGPLGYDANNSNATYRVGSTMTGGSSGGPWFQGFNATTGTGTIMSVTSYGYSGVKALFGPKLNDETGDMFKLAGQVDLAAGNQLG